VLICVVDCDKQKELSNLHQVRGIQDLRLYRKGEQVKQQTGYGGSLADLASRGAFSLSSCGRASNTAATQGITNRNRCAGDDPPAAVRFLEKFRVEPGEARVIDVDRAAARVATDRDPRKHEREDMARASAAELHEGIARLGGRPLRCHQAGRL